MLAAARRLSSAAPRAARRASGNGDTHEAVKDYYARVLQTSDDLKTNACCTSEAMPTTVKAALRNVHDEVLAKYYGCGIVAPDALRGRRVLDLGCGAGRDVYALAQFVGEHGEVVGVDMTAAQLDVACAHEEWHRARFGYARKNTRFVRGYLEHLDELRGELEPGSFDVVVSNCVLNLSPDKPAVLAHVHELLADGGEFYFSDVYADRRVPTELQRDRVLWGECLSGALYWRDFEQMARAAGFADPRMVKSKPISVNNDLLERRVGHLEFASLTYRLFKLPPGELEPGAEDYGDAVVYKGTIEAHPQRWDLDARHRMWTGKALAVSRNTYTTLRASRFGEHFELIGGGKTHFGPFADDSDGSLIADRFAARDDSK